MSNLLYYVVIWTSFTSSCSFSSNKTNPYWALWIFSLEVWSSSLWSLSTSERNHSSEESVAAILIFFKLGSFPPYQTIMVLNGWLAEWLFNFHFNGYLTPSNQDKFWERQSDVGSTLRGWWKSNKTERYRLRYNIDNPVRRRNIVILQCERLNLRLQNQNLNQ